ncbi:MAG: phospholipid carrier-dependent glycosyltransferase [Chloroflexi bacterium]|nr:phospholipid carrier-dependent glycosyltransferase [Chloroflexota bacterium]
MRKFFPQSSVLSPQSFIDVLFLLALIIYMLAGTASVPFHGDESTQIYMSRDYAYQFLQGDLDLVRYHDPPINATEQQLRLLNGTLNKYLIGFMWHLGGFNIDQINDQWDWGGDWNYNQSNNHAPSEALLQISRIPSAILLAAGVIVMFALGRMLGGRSVAYLASLYYALNPALLIEGRRAMMEGSLTFFSLLVVLAGVLLLQKRRWWTAILLGLAAGLALASKHTAVFTLVAVFGACVVYPVIEWVGEKWVRHKTDLTPDPSPLRREGRKAWAHSRAPLPEPSVSQTGADTGAPLQESSGGRARHASPLHIYGMLVVAGVLALVVFYGMNPAWWGDPVTRAGQVLAMRNDLLAGQTAAFGGYSSLSGALSGWFRQVFVNTPQYYEIPAWAGYIAEPIARYESSIWRGVSVGGTALGGVILLALTAIGGVAVMGRKLALTQAVGDISTAQQKAQSVSARVLILVWALAMLATTAFLTPIEWQRYYLPAYPAVGLLGAAGLVWVVQRVRKGFS